MLSAVTACLVPSNLKAVATQQPIDKNGIPLIRMTHSLGDTAGYRTHGEDPSHDPELTATHDAAFIPSNRFLVYVVPVQEAVTTTNPLEVPKHFGSDGWGSVCASRADGDWLTKDEALSQVWHHNSRLIGSDANEWAIAVELGEPQGSVMSCLEFGPETFWLLTTSQHRPVRVCNLSATPNDLYPRRMR